MSTLNPSAQQKLQEEAFNGKPRIFYFVEDIGENEL